MFRNDCTDTIHRFPDTLPGWKAWLGAGWALFLADARALGGLPAMWRRRARGRRDLARLSDAQLRDIGLDRDRAGAESAKPFWRA